jgi:hypothetical protein
MVAWSIGATQPSGILPLSYALVWKILQARQLFKRVGIAPSTLARRNINGNALGCIAFPRILLLER